MNDKIVLDGVTKRQKELLDIMWNIDSHNDLVEWTKTLDKDDANDVIILIELIKMELIDQVIDEDNDYSEAISQINKCRG